MPSRSLGPNPWGRLVQGLVAFLKGLGAARLMAMVAVTTALLGFFAFVIMRVTTPQMTTLFTDLSAEDSSAIIKDLERQAIPFELRNEGAVIMVPKDKVTRLRMKLAESGLPKGGGVGYEIFDKSDALGTTSFVQNINHLRALEGELARTIRAIDRIQAARVHLVLPERPLFSRETPEPSASIVVRVRGALEPQQIRAIRHVVASAVNGLKPQRVSIVDEAGQLLADGASKRSRQRRRRRAPRRLREADAQRRSRRSSPRWSARAAPASSSTADFDYNKITQTSDKFDPEGRVLRSSQTREESSASADDGGQVTVNNELPGNQANATARRRATRARRAKRPTITRFPAPPRPKSPRPAGSTGSRSRCWSTAPTPRTKKARWSIRTAARNSSTASPRWCARRSASTRSAATRSRSSTSASPKRRRCRRSLEPTGLLGMLQFTKDDVMYVIELGVMMLLGLVVLFMVIRPLVKRILAAEVVPAPRRTAAGVDRRQRTDDGAGQALLPGTSGAAQLIDVAQVQGQVHAQAVHRVGELAERNPNETASIVRQWLSEPAEI